MKDKTARASRHDPTPSGRSVVEDSRLQESYPSISLIHPLIDKRVWRWPLALLSLINSRSNQLLVVWQRCASQGFDIVLQSG